MPPGPEASSGELLAVGRIGRAHGVRGEVVVRQLSEVEERFVPGSVLRLGPDGSRVVTVRSSRPHRNRLLVRFEGVGDRDEAERLTGSLLLVPASEAPALPEGRFWVHRVVGLEVVTEAGRSLGAIREVLHTPANDVWVTDRAMIPAVRETVLRVDLDTRRVLVRDVPGMEVG